MISEGLTENVSPAGALVSLDYLPGIGSRLFVTVWEVGGVLVEAQAEVVRLDHSLTPPSTAALYILGDNQQWQASVWEAARRCASQSATVNGLDKP